MPKHLLLLVFGFILFTQSYGQNIRVSDPNSHKAFVENLDASKDSKYQEILEAYNDYILANPDDVLVKIEKCKFIGLAYYDYYEDYDTNWEETEACVDLLYKDYPENPSVVIYKLEQLWGEEQTALLERVVDNYYTDDSAWNEKNTAILFEMSADALSDTNQSRALRHLEIAEENDPELDVSLLKARIMQDLGNEAGATAALKAHIDADVEVWILNQKAKLLVELEEYDTAMEVFDRVKEKDSTYIDNESLYTILIGGNQPELARTYLVEDTISEWNKEGSLQMLLRHDIDYGDSETALTSYKRMQDENYYDDLFGIKRLEIFLNDPFGSFSTVGISHFFFLGLLMILLFAIPYLWVLPVYGVGTLLKNKFEYKRFWNLKHFWLISFLYLFVQVLLVLVFYYEDYMNYIFDIGSSYYGDESDDLIQPNEMFFFSICMLLITVAFLNKKRLYYVLSSNWSVLRIVGMSIAFFIFNIFLLNILGRFVDITDATTYFAPLNIKEEIALLLNDKGFFVTVLIVAVLAPFYEEIIFRGIILNSARRYIGIVPANMLQAALFGLIHFNLALFPFYFVFGLITGRVARTTNGLLAGIGFHMLNNFIVVVVLYYATKLAANF